MQKTVSALTLALLLTVGAGAAHARILSHVQTNDLAGFVFGNETYSDGSTLTVMVTGYRSGAVDSPIAGQDGQATGYVNYFVSLCSADGTVCTTQLGYGFVPSSAVTGGSRHERLYVDTSTIAGYVNEVCTVNTVTGESNCSPATGGLVDITWKAGPKTPVSKQAGSYSYEVPGARVTTTGSSTFVNAPATGVVLGSPIPEDAYSQIQTIKNGTITIETR